MEITVTSRETIKPSSPTPPHLRHLKLSLIDQYITPDDTIFIPILLFYSAQGDVHRFRSTNMSDRLKTSLSGVLTEFYPVVGKYENNRSIHCNDEGLEYVEARVKAPLTLGHLLKNPQAEELNRLLPYDMYKAGTRFGKLSAVQVTVFDGCGGMAIGVSLSHVIGDGQSLAMFVKRWAAVARGDTSIRIPPEFGFASLFPSRDVPELQMSDFIDEVAAGRPPPKQVISKRFVFHQRKIDNLKASIHVDHCPTRVEAVSALLFKCFINAGEAPSSKSVMLDTAINLRSRMRPPLGMHHFGNLALPWTVEHTGAISLNDLAVQLRKMIREVDSDYIEKLRADNALLLHEKFEGWMKLYTMTDVQHFHLSSRCKFPFYEVDFGWGAPTWAAPCYPAYPFITLIDAKNGDGIEAWVTLDDDAMARFESNKELLDFASPNPAVQESDSA